MVSGLSSILVSVSTILHGGSGIWHVLYLSRCLSSLFLKAFNEGAETTESGSEFHLETTLMEK